MGACWHVPRKSMVKCYSFGLGLCLQESWSIYPKTVKKHIDHPDNEIIWCGVAIGYEDENHPINKYRTRRENLDSFVKFID